MVIWILGFDHNRLTIADFRDVHLLAVSLRLMTRLCPLQAFLMPAYRDNPCRHREGKDRSSIQLLVHCWCTLLCGLAPRRVGSMTVLLALLGNMPGEVCRDPHLLDNPTSPRLSVELPLTLIYDARHLLFL